MQIVMRKLSELTPYAHNPRDNAGAVDAVARSIREFGFRNPVIIDKDGVIVAGHTRVLAAKALDAKKGKDIKVYCSTFFDENDDAAAAAEFVSGFKAWLNADSGKLTNNGGNDIVAAVSALGFDAYNVALAAIKAADSADAAAIVEALPGVTYEGVTGAIAFDDVGDAKKDMAYIKFANPETGAFDFVKTQKVGE